MFCYIYYWFTIFILQMLHILIDVSTFSFSRHIPIHFWQCWMDKCKNWFIKIPFTFYPNKIFFEYLLSLKLWKSLENRNSKIFVEKQKLIAKLILKIHFPFFLGHCFVLFVSEYLTSTYHGDFLRKQKNGPSDKTNKKPK